VMNGQQKEALPTVSHRFGFEREFVPGRSAKKNRHRHHNISMTMYLQSTGSPSYQPPDFIHITHRFVILFSGCLKMFWNLKTKAQKTPQLSCKQVSILVYIKKQKNVLICWALRFWDTPTAEKSNSNPSGLYFWELLRFNWPSRGPAFLHRLQHLFGKWTCCRRFLALPGLERWKDQARVPP